jgi:hypothetical protein
MHTYRKWVPPVSTAIPDIHGWLADMSSAREFAERLIQEAESEDAEGVLIRALSGYFHPILPMLYDRAA